MYISGEENAEQIAARAHRLGLKVCPIVLSCCVLSCCAVLPEPYSTPTSINTNIAHSLTHSFAHSLTYTHKVDNVFLLCDTDADFCVDTILALPQLPQCIIVDSVQTMRVEACASGLGSVTHIREATLKFVQVPPHATITPT